MSKISKLFYGVFFISIILKFIDVIKNLLIASKLGVSSSADVYLSLISIPESLIVLLGLDTLRGVVNSEFSFLDKENDRNEIQIAYQNLFTITCVFSLLLVFVIIVCKSYIIDILLPGFDFNQKLLAIEVAMFIFPIFFFKGIIGFLQSILNSYKKFYFPTIILGIVSILIICSIFLPYYNSKLVFNLAIANLLGNAIICVLLLFYARRLGLKSNLRFYGFDKLTKKIFKGSLVMLVLVFSNQLYLFSKNYFASFFGEGAVASLNYAGSISFIANSLIFSSIFGVLLSNLSISFAKEIKTKSKKLFTSTLIKICFVIIPLIVLCLVYNKEILKIIYLRGKFDIAGIEKTSSPFYWEVAGIFSFVLYIIPTALFLAKKEYKLLTYIGCIFYLTGIGMNYFLTKAFDVTGVAMTNFIIGLVYGATLLFFSRKFLGRYFGELKAILFLIISGLIIYILLSFLRVFFFDAILSDDIINIVIVLLVNGMITILLYLILTSIFKVNFVSSLRILFKKEK